MPTLLPYSITTRRPAGHSGDSSTSRHPRTAGSAGKAAPQMHAGFELFILTQAAPKYPSGRRGGVVGPNKWLHRVR
jgi:hypothetical protein